MGTAQKAPVVWMLRFHKRLFHGVLVLVAIIVVIHVIPLGGFQNNPTVFNGRGHVGNDTQVFPILSIGVRHFLAQQP